MSNYARGGQLTKRPPLLAGDGESFLCVCDSDVRVYSARTGVLLSALRGHSAEVTALAPNPLNSRQVFSAARDGTLCCWDVVSGQLLQRLSLGEAVHGLVASPQAALLYASIRCGSSEGRVQALQLPSCTPLEGRWRFRDVPTLATSTSGRYIAAVERHSLHVWVAGSPASVKPINFKHTKAYTCAAIDPSDTILAAGDVSGRILLWHDFAAMVRAAQTAAVGGGSSTATAPAVSTVHWHAHPVGALCFSSDSVYLLSGGVEGVLVQWAVATGARNYLPRLGGPISAITTSPAQPARYLLAQGDNTLRLVNTATMGVELSVHGMRPAPAPLRRLPPAPGHWAPKGEARGALGTAGPAWYAARAAGRPVVQPGSGHLVLPCEHSLLQFFDVTRDRHVGRLQVSPRNPVSLTTEGAAPLAAVGHPQVTLLAFSSDASAMATIDVWPDTSSCGGISSSLKFWDSSSSVGGSSVAGSSSPYVVNTRADAPHPGGDVTGCAYHPRQHMVATCGTDGEFRVWVRNTVRRSAVAAAAAGDGSAGRATSTAWHCRSVGSYKQQPMAHCCFSPDGSLLAVAAGATATLWDPLSNSLVAALAPRALAAGAHAATAAAEEGSSSEVLVQLAFLSGSPHLVGLYTPRSSTSTLESSSNSREAGGSSSSSRGSLGAPQRLVVWDLLRSTVAWSVAVHCCSLAVDKQLPLIAVGVPATPEMAAAAAAIQRQHPHKQLLEPAAAEVDAVAAAGGVPDKGKDKGPRGETEQEEDGVGPGSREGRRAQRWKELRAKRAANKPHGMEEDAPTSPSKQTKPHKQQQPADTEGDAAAGASVQEAAGISRQQQLANARAGLVLVFNVASPTPEFSCAVPRSSPAHLLFLERGSPLGALSADAVLPSISPLMILTRDRRVSFAASPQLLLQQQQGTQQQQQQAAKPAHAAVQKTQQQGSVLDAVFGAAVPAAAGSSGTGNFDAVAAKAALQRLFDAPSHVLPPPSSLAPTMLELLLQGGS